MMKKVRFQIHKVCFELHRDGFREGIPYVGEIDNQGAIWIDIPNGHAVVFPGNYTLTN